MTDEKLYCGNCVFWEWRRPRGEAAAECHRYPPRGGSQEWPVVSRAQWCGELRTADGRDAFGRKS